MYTSHALVYTFKFTKLRTEKVVPSCSQTFIANVSGYVTVKYDAQSWFGCIITNSQELNEVNFLHPNDLSNSFD